MFFEKKKAKLFEGFVLIFANDKRDSYGHIV